MTGAAAIDGVATAVNRANGSTKGAALAAKMQKFTRPRGSPAWSASRLCCSAFRPAYRVIEIERHQAEVRRLVGDEVVPKL